MSATSQTPVAAHAAPSGWQYALRILIGCIIVWFIMNRFHHPNPLWAIISVIVVTEPERNAALLAFNSRIANTLLGCAVGLCCLYLLGPSFWSILLGIIVAVILCTNFIRLPGSWRISPITVAIVMTPSVLHGTSSSGLGEAVERTAEVILGSAVALLITYAALLISHFVNRSRPAL